MSLAERNITAGPGINIPGLPYYDRMTPVDGQAVVASGLDFANKVKDNWEIKPLERAAKTQQLLDAADQAKANLVLRPLTTRRDAQQIQGAIDLFPKAQSNLSGKLDLEGATTEGQLKVLPAQQATAQAEADVSSALAQGKKQYTGALLNVQGNTIDTGAVKSQADLLAAKQALSDPSGNAAAIRGHLNSLGVPFSDAASPEENAGALQKALDAVAERQIRTKTLEVLNPVKKAEMQRQMVNDFEGTKETKDFRGVQSAWHDAEALTSTIGKDGLTGTQAEDLKFAFLRSVNPEATRLQLKQADGLISATQSMPEWIRGRVTQALTGSNIDAQLAKQLRDTIEANYQRKLVDHKARVGIQRAQATDLGLNPNLVVHTATDAERSILGLGQPKGAPASVGTPALPPPDAGPEARFGTVNIGGRQVSGHISTDGKFYAIDGTVYAPDGSVIPRRDK